MEIRVLGPLEARVDGRAVDLGGAKRRAVLALPALNTNEVVGADRLIETLWQEHAPRDATGALHNHVSRLRKSLAPDAIATRQWGYVLRADPHEIGRLRRSVWRLVP